MKHTAQLSSPNRKVWPRCSRLRQLGEKAHQVPSGSGSSPWYPFKGRSSGWIELSPHYLRTAFTLSCLPAGNLWCWWSDASRGPSVGFMMLWMKHSEMCHLRPLRWADQVEECVMNGCIGAFDHENKAVFTLLCLDAQFRFVTYNQGWSGQRVDRDISQSASRPMSSREQAHKLLCAAVRRSWPVGL